jgi:DNA invertase Pin-like site-specific DNA recombinase
VVFKFQSCGILQELVPHLYTDQVSGVKVDRPGLQDALAYVRRGDSLVVWRLDRLGRSLKHLIATIEDLENRGVGLVSLQEGLDTTTAGGRLIFHIFGALAEFERNLIRERTQAGLAAARTRGRKGGRKHKLEPDQVETLHRMYHSKQHSVKEICQVMGISKPTLYAYLGNGADSSN